VIEQPLRRIEELIAEALDRPPEDRDNFLDQACGDDRALRREVGELLGLHDEAAKFFDDLSSDIVSAAALEIECAARPRMRIGPYRTLEAIGHGGMGAVYRAKRVDGAFDQEVALKLLHRDMETPELMARFLAERQLLAHLSHPNIAHLFDGGVTDEGRPYFVMEVIEGLPITGYCEQNDCSTEDMLRLFMDVIEAVSYLHRNLVVHRDLKPSNIFVDRDGAVKLLDFGIAKLLAEAPQGELHTRTGELLMTPEYAAPEQLLGTPVTTATDVYALGVVLYELLTGERPRRRAATDGRSATEDLPPTPSSKLRSRRRTKDAAPAGQGGERPTAEKGLSSRRIDSDLDNICLMALRPEAEARYSSAEQLGQDIQRYLEGLPVHARKSTLGYRVGKFAQRHRRAMLATGVLLVLIAVGFARERSLRGEAEQARSEAQRQAAKAVVVSDFLSELLSSVDPGKAQGREVAVADVLDQAAIRLGANSEFADQPQVEAALRATIGNTYVSLGKYAEATEHLERVVELRGGLESRDPEALAAASDLAVLYQRLGLIDKAEPMLRRALELRVEVLGEDHPTSLTTMNRLADLLWADGRYDEVELLDRRTLEIRRRVLGEDHPDTIKSLNGLAATLFNDGRYAEAAQLFEEALQVERRQLGEHHPHTLTLGNNLAAAYLELCRYAEAEKLLREIIAGRILVLGEAHGETAMSVHNLGVALVEQARYEEAEEQLKRAMAVRQSIAADGNDFLFTSSHLADVYRDQGRYQDAEALYLSTLKQQRELRGPESQDTLRTVGSLAELRILQGDLAAAEALIVEILVVQERVRGEGHPDTLYSLTLLARIRNEQGRFVEAQSMSEQAIEVGSEALGAGHRVVLEAVFEHARALAGQQQMHAAQELAIRVYEGRERILGADHPDTIEASDFLNSL